MSPQDPQEPSQEGQVKPGAQETQGGTQRQVPEGDRLQGTPGGPHVTEGAEGTTAAGEAKDAVPAVAEPSTEVVYCVQCGSVMNRGDVFCHACGWDSRVPPPPPAPAPSAQIEPDPSAHNRLTILLLCVLLGWLGVHRFYVGKVGTGIIWLLTMGFLWLGVVFDLVLIATGEFRDSTGRRIVRWE